MKDILYKKRQSQKFDRKTISIAEKNEDKDCHTLVRKSFIYLMSKSKNTQTIAEPPEIFIRKSFNNKKRQEKFSFRVKGYFFIGYHRTIFKVDFCHTLKIDIDWKEHIFSPKKSATLT